MTLNFLEKRIKERAEGRFYRELNNLSQVISKSPIGKDLKIAAGDKVFNLVDNSPIALLSINSWTLTNLGKENTNILKIKEELIEEYEEEETDAILKQMGSLRDFLEQQPLNKESKDDLPF